MRVSFGLLLVCVTAVAMSGQAFGQHYMMNDPAVMPTSAEEPQMQEEAVKPEMYLTAQETIACGEEPGCYDETCVPACGRPSIFGDFEVGGWVQMGIYGNGWGADDNGPLGMNDRSGAALHQAWGYIAKEVDTSCKRIDWGGRIDFVWGADGPDTQCFGDGSWDSGWNSAGGDQPYGSSIPQIYGEIGVGDLTVKAGHFYTIIGYEVVQAPDNFFFSHAYTMYYGEPFTHTGMLASYSIAGGDLTLMGGWVNGWDNGFGNNTGGSMMLGGISAQLTDAVALTWAFTTGDQGTAGSNLTVNDIFMQSIVLSVDLSDNLQYVFQSDIGQQVQRTVGSRDKSEWYGINQYLLYTINDMYSVGARLEWFHDDDAARGLAATAGNYYGMTFGVNIRPCCDDTIIIRPEVRYDTFDPLAGDNNARPFDNGTRATQIAGGFDIIWQF